MLRSKCVRSYSMREYIFDLAPKHVVAMRMHRIWDTPKSTRPETSTFTKYTKLKVAMMPAEETST